VRFFVADQRACGVLVPSTLASQRFSEDFVAEKARCTRLVPLQRWPAPARPVLVVANERNARCLVNSVAPCGRVDTVA
jgi:hypothetical protein